MARNGSGTYVRVHDWTDDRDAAIPITASRVDEEMDDVATALTNSLAKDGQTTPTANLPMGGYKLTGLGSGSARTDSLTAGQVQDSATQHGTVGGTANAITLTLTPAITAYAAGQRFSFVAGAVNTGAVTLNVSAVGAKAITKNGTAALVGGEIANGALIEAIYDGTQFQLVSNNPTEATAFWGGTSGGSANAQTVTLAPVPGAYYAGMEVTFLAGNTNTGATTLNCNSLGAKNIYVANAACVGGEILSGKAYTVVYDGTQFQMISPPNTGRGGLIGFQKFTSSGTSTYTPTAGTNSVYVLCVGAGGGGGGAATTGAGQAAAGGGGGGGGTAAKRITSSFSGVTVTVGAKGTGGSAGANAGNAGGDSSFGSLVVAKGGSGGTAGTLTGAFPSQNAWVAGGAASGATGDVLADGGAGQGAIYFSSANAASGFGGSGANGSGGGRPAVGNPGAAAGNPSSTSAPGGGGSGAVVTASLTQQAGGNGSDGACYVWEYN